MDKIRQYLKKSLFLRRLVRWRRARTTAFPDWGKFLASDGEWRQALEKTGEGPKVLVATSMGSHWPGTTVESLLGVALTLRGAQIHVLLCDSALPACQECIQTWFSTSESFTRSGPGFLCRSCFEPAYRMYASLGFQVHRYSELITDEERANAARLAESIPFEDIDDYKLANLAVGEHAMAGALRFFARGDLRSEPEAEGVLRRYFQAALLTAYAVQRLMDKVNFTVAVFHHGIYVPQGIIGEVARSKKVRVVNWNPAYRKKCFIFSHGDTYHHTLMDEPVTKWESVIRSEKAHAVLTDYLKSRWYGTKDWIWFHERPEHNVREIAKELGVDFSKPSIGLLTNVMWDAQLHYPANAFANMLDWILQTIDYFATRPDLQLIIRIHPAEIRGTVPSRQPVAAEIKRHYPVLPPNIFVIPPESNISTYATMQECDSVIIYGTKTGVELTSMGIPVIVAGEAWIRNKGITFDATSVEDYFQILNRLPLGKRLGNDEIERACRYAYHFFFRRMIPVACMNPVRGWPPYEISIENVCDLLPGRDPGLDVICDGILGGEDFIFRAEEYI